MPADEAMYISSDEEPTISARPPEVVCTGQFRKRTIPAPARKRESTAPRVPPSQPVTIVIDSDSDEPSVTSTVPGAQETSLSKAIREAKEKQLEQQRKNAGPSQTEEKEVNVIPDSDDEERYAAYDLDYSPNWAPTGFSLGEGQLARDLKQEIADVSLEFARLMSDRRKERAKTARNSLFTAPATGVLTKPTTIRGRKGAQPYVWAMLQRDTAERTKRGRRAPTSNSVKHLRPATRFLMASTEVHANFAPGSVNSITQANGLIAVASCTLGGGADEEDANMPYNLSGTLKVISGDSTFTLDGHKAVIGSNNRTDDRRVKHYTVNEAQFDPANPTQLASCGQDKKVIVWDCDPGLSKPTKLKSVNYKHVPDGLQFKPAGNTFATWTSKGEIGIHKGLDEPVIKQWTPKPEPIQSVLWGRGRLQHLLFFTTEAGKTVIKGKHLALDVEHGRTKAFSDKIAGGECLDLDATGTHLAHVTCARRGIMELSVLDTRAENKATQDVPLPPFKFDLGGDTDEPAAGPMVQQVLYSPDSLYVAVARNDNVVLVYDARFLRKGPLYDFPHLPPNEGAEDDRYHGITYIEWHEERTQGLSLVSGGADGCVRLWDMKRAHDPSADTVIAKSVSYVGWFSLGDTFRGEKALVMGDGSGNLVVKE